jgi:WD40 repeat protein
MQRPAIGIDERPHLTAGVVFGVGLILILAMHVSAWRARPELRARVDRSTFPERSAGSRAVFSPDGSSVLAARFLRTARVWDAKTGRLRFELAGHTAQILAAEFSPDGSQIATAGADHPVKIWDAKTGRLQFDLEGHTTTVEQLRYGPDGSQLMTTSRGAGEHLVNVWDPRTGALRFAISATVWATYSPDGKRILALPLAPMTVAHVLDARTGKVLRSLDQRADIEDAVYRPDGAQLVTAGADHRAIVWDARTGKQLVVLVGHAGSIIGVEFSPSGAQILTSSYDCTAKLWDARTGKLLHSLDEHAPPPDEHDPPRPCLVRRARFSPDGATVVTASHDGTAILWNANTGEDVFYLARHSHFVIDASFSPDGAQVITQSVDNTAKVWDVRTGRLVFTAEHAIGSVEFSPDGLQLFTTGNDYTARVWTPTGQLVFELEDLAKLVSTAQSPGGDKIVTSGLDATPTVFDATTGTALFQLAGHTAAVRSVEFSPAGDQIATTSADHSAKLWDARTGKLLVTLDELDYLCDVNGSEYSRDGAWLLTTTTRTGACIWNTKTGRLDRHLWTEATTLAVRYSPDGSRIVAAESNGTALVWTTASRSRSSALADGSDVSCGCVVRNRGSA